MRIPFNKPFIIGKEYEYIKEAIKNGKISGNGVFTKKCNNYIQDTFDIKKAFLTTSCTDALEMSGLLIDLKPGDEVIMPSFTFVSTANAVLLRGAIPRFIDIRRDTLNMDETLIKDTINDRTKAILPVHYAGVPCEMDTIMKLAEEFAIYVIEDAAQGIDSKYKGRPIGSIGHLAAFSFHETKNIISGEGGALLVNDEEMVERAEIIWEKGTNRTKFFRGEIDKYTWVDIGSSFLPSELTAAFLWAQFEHLNEIQQRRNYLWQRYFEGLSGVSDILLPTIPQDILHNSHIFQILLPSEELRDSLMTHLKSKGILAVFHYVPLHTSPKGMELGYKENDFPVTEEISGRLLRLPLFHDLKEIEQDEIIAIIKDFLN